MKIEKLIIPFSFIGNEEINETSTGCTLASPNISNILYKVEKGKRVKILPISDRKMIEIECKRTVISGSHALSTSAGHGTDVSLGIDSFLLTFGEANSLGLAEKYSYTSQNSFIQLDFDIYKRDGDNATNNNISNWDFLTDIVLLEDEEIRIDMLSDIVTTFRGSIHKPMHQIEFNIELNLLLLIEDNI